MGKRGAVPWAATSMPDIRRQWCRAIDAVADYSWDALDAELPPQAPAQLIAMSRRIVQMKAKIASVSEVLKVEAAAIRSATLYWVSRDAVDTVMHAAETLPEWTPAIAAPAPSGFLCWAKSAGTTTWATPSVEHVEASLRSGSAYSPTPLTAAANTTELPWDGIVWWTRPDGLMQLLPCSRDTSAATMLNRVGVSSPVWGSHTVMLNPAVPRTAEVQKAAGSHRFVSGLGAAWLLMGQENVTETRTIGQSTPPAPPPDSDTADQEASPPPTSAVTIVELLRRRSTARRSAGTGKQLDHRISVEGYWRQQPCGPRNSQRRPKYIDDYEKGPANAPLIAKERVHVLRNRPSTGL
ncbi:hypothetical protein H7J86_32765 [Mycobacterium hackensackense]|nr:hypothetical protein [Mycobacterium hackensackense]